MADKGFYILAGVPDVLETDQSHTFTIYTSPDKDMTGVTYTFGYEFTCDGVTTSKTVASGLTATSYTWTPTVNTFGPLMTKSESGNLKIKVETVNGQHVTYVRDVQLNLASSVKPQIRTDYITIERTNAFNGQTISNVTSHRLSIGVLAYAVYGVSQTVTVTIGSATYSKTVEAYIEGSSGESIPSVSFDIGSFDSGSADTLVKNVDINITDARGRSASASIPITVYKYTPPSVTASIARNETEVPVLTFSSSYQETVAGGTNTIKQFYARCVVGSEIYQTDLMGKTSPQELTGTYSIDKAYSFIVLIQDSVRPSAIITRLTLPSNKPVIDIGADGKTVTFFGTSPESSDELSLRVKSDTSSVHMSTDGLIMIEDFHNAGKVAELAFYKNKDSDGNVTQCWPYFSLGTRIIEDGTKPGGYSLTTGYDTSATGHSALATGYHTSATGEYQTVVGKNNIPDTTSAFIIGNGTTVRYKSNAFTVDFDGRVGLHGNIAYKGANNPNYKTAIEFIDSSDSYGNSMLIGNGGNVIIGSGESPNAVYTALELTPGSESTYITSDNEIYMVPKCNTIADRKPYIPYYKRGDSLTITWTGAGYVTNSSKDVSFEIPFAKPILSGTTVTVTSVNGFILRQRNSSTGGSYTHGSSASAYAKPSSYSVTIRNESRVAATAKFSTTTNAVNNAAIGIYANIKVTFS